MSHEDHLAAVFPLIKQVNAEGRAVQIGSHGDEAVLMPSDQYTQWADTAYLFKSPANGKRLLGAYEHALAGAFREHEMPFEAPERQGLAIRLTWADEAWEDYNSWRDENPEIFEHINALLAAALKEPGEGIGHPVAHKYGTTRAWSRDITDVHRLVYMIEEDEEVGTADLIVLQARYYQ